MSGALLGTRLVQAQWRRVGLPIAGGPVIAGGLVAVAGGLVTSPWPASQALALVTWPARALVICAALCVARARTGAALSEPRQWTSVGERTGLPARRWSRA